jgi:hypothetical protein
MLVGVLGALGQSLFAPPNVKGWPGGKAWLNTATLLERANFAESLAMGTMWATRPPEPSTSAAGGSFNLRRIVSAITSSIVPVELPDEPAPPRAFDPARIVADEGVTSALEVVRVVLELYLPGGVPSETRAKLVAFVGAGSPKGHALDRRVREVVHAILSLAEYQLS